MTPTEEPQELLCRWIYHSGNKATSDLYFTAYYNAVAGPGKPLYNYVYRMPDPEEVLQEAFIGFVGYVKRRPIAAIRILKRLPSVGLSTRGEFYEKRAMKWTNDSENWMRRIMVFCAENCGDNITQPFIVERTISINGELAPLLREGFSLLSWAIFYPSETEASEGDENPNLEQDDEEYSGHVVNRLIKQVNEWLEKSASQSDKDLGVQRDEEFAINMKEILKDMPKITIPFTKLLFFLANNRHSERYRGSDFYVKGILISDESEDGDADPFESIEVIEKTSRSPDPIVEGAVIRAVESPKPFWNSMLKTLQSRIEEAEVVFHSAKTKGERRNALVLLEKRWKTYFEEVSLLALWLDDRTITDIGRELELDRKTVRKRLNGIWEKLAPLMNT